MLQMTNNINAQKAKPSELNHWFKHNERAHFLENVNPAKTHLNQEFLKKLFPNFKNPTPQVLLNQLAQDKAQHHLKDNGAIPFLKIVSTFNPADRTTKPTAEELSKWARAEIDFLKSEWGAENIKAVYFHLDEETPHFHILIYTLDKQKQKEKEIYFIEQNGRKIQIKAAERKQKRAQGFKVKREIQLQQSAATAFNSNKWFKNKTTLKQMKQRHTDFLKARGFEIIKAPPSPIAINNIKEYKKHIKQLEALFPQKNPADFKSLKIFLNQTIENTIKDPAQAPAQLEALNKIFNFTPEQFKEVKSYIEAVVKAKTTTAKIKNTWDFEM